MIVIGDRDHSGAVFYIMSQSGHVQQSPVCHIARQGRQMGKIIIQGTPPDLLTCEFEAVGYRRAAFREMPGIGGYYATFVRVGRRPEPGEIEPCGQE